MVLVSKSLAEHTPPRPAAAILAPKKNTFRCQFPISVLFYVNIPRGGFSLQTCATEALAGDTIHAVPCLEGLYNITEDAGPGVGTLVLQGAGSGWV